MKLLLALLTLLAYGAAELCVIKTANDLDTANSCTLLILDGDNSVMQNPQLFDKIKMATTYEHFELTNSKLDRFSEIDTVVLPKGATLKIIDNANLRKMPKFHIVDGTDIKITVLGNPKLDTRQLLQECAAKGCNEKTMMTIQAAYSCRPSSPIPHGCRALFGEVLLENYDKSWNEVEIIYGTISLKNSKLERAPKLAKLVTVEQIGKNPVLIIENNQKLQKVDALLNVNYKIKHKKNAVVIIGNPELCIDSKNDVNTVVLESFKEVHPCNSAPLLHQYKRKRVARDTGTEGKSESNEGGETAGTSGEKLDLNKNETTEATSGNETDSNASVTSKNETGVNSVYPEQNELDLIGSGNDTRKDSGSDTKTDDNGANDAGSLSGDSPVLEKVASRNESHSDNKSADSEGSATPETSLGSSLTKNSCWISILIYALYLSLQIP